MATVKAPSKVFTKKKKTPQKWKKYKVPKNTNAKALITYACSTCGAK